MKRINLIICALLGALLMSSCGKWLDVLPKSEIPAEKVFDSEEGFFSALAGVYVKMTDKNAYGCALTIRELEIMSNTMSMPWAMYIDGYDGDFNCLAKFDYAREGRYEHTEKAFTAIWSASYKIIANDNLLISHLEKVSSEMFEPGLKNLMLGEALALRAYVHFDLMRIFQPPYLSTEGKTQKRIPYKETYGMDFTSSSSSDELFTKINADITRALTLMEKTDPISSSSRYSSAIAGGNRIHKMNYYAVKALQARVALYQGKYQEAYDAAIIVINAANGLGIRFINDTDIATKDSKKYPVMASCPMESIFGLVVDDLSEYVYFYANTGYSYGERFRLQTSRYKAGAFFSSATDRRIELWKKGKRSNIYIGKYEQSTLPADKVLYPTPTVQLLKLGEMYLIAAEAAAEAVSTTEALRLLTLLQNDRKGGVFSSNDKEEIITEIIKEYRRELIGDGQVFYAYKRRNLAKIDKGYLASGTHTMTVEKYTPDIPATEFNGGRTY